jgi:hypothetical protein
MVPKAGAHSALIMSSNMIKVSVPLPVTVPDFCGHNTKMLSEFHSGKKHVVIISLSREREV